MNISRRHALGLGAFAALAPSLGFATMPAPAGKRFCLIILRGAMDGLSAVAPLSDPDYAALRPGLALGTPAAPNGAVPLDGRFWLHPALAKLQPLYAAKQMLVLHAMASPYRDRSHFDAQNMIETGMCRPNASGDGWLNRALAALGAGPVRGVAFAPELPLVLQGHATAANWQPPRKQNDIHAAVARMYQADPVLTAAYQAGLAAKGIIDTAGGATAKGRDFKSLAEIAGRTLAAEDGPNAAVLEIGGWDTHVAQGTQKGRLANALGALADGILALKQGLGPAWHQTIVVAITEFGRTAHANGTGGTDHGTATAGFAFGGPLNGGRVLTDWPGLSKTALYQNRDLAPTTDLRSLLKSILADHLNIPAQRLNQSIFPNSPTARPLLDLVRV